MSVFWSDSSSTSIIQLSEQRRLWRDCADVQDRLSLRWSPMWSHELAHFILQLNKIKLVQAFQKSKVPKRMLSESQIQNFSNNSISVYAFRVMCQPERYEHSSHIKRLAFLNQSSSAVLPDAWNDEEKCKICQDMTTDFCSTFSCNTFHQFPSLAVQNEYQSYFHWFESENLK